jgi:hypothetical protein
LQSRSRVSSRVRRIGSDAFGVLDHPLVDDVGEVPFKRPQRLHGRPSLGQAAPVVGAAEGVAAELDDGHDVQHPVDAPVAGAGEPVALLVAGGSLLPVRSATSKHLGTTTVIQIR